MNTSTVIKPWDWHYKVGFDETLRQDIMNSIYSLEQTSYKKVLLNQLELFSNFISVSQLIDCLARKEVNQHTQLNLEGKSILFIPEFLGQKYLQLTEGLTDISWKLKKELVSIIKSGIKSNYCNYDIDIFSLTFGDCLSMLMTQANNNPVERFVEKPIERNDIANAVKKLVPYIINNPPEQLKGLVQYIPAFDIKFREGQGFAEYWAKGMVGNNNELIVMINDDHLGYSNLKATIAHELLGHAIFYNLADILNPSFFDHGAFSLIEGWATWCEWNASDPLFARNLRSSRCQILKLLDKTDPADIQEQIACEALATGYSEKVAKMNIEYYFQYPGFVQSYTLGALWFENRFTNETPTTFFNSLKQLPWGDFFSLW